MNVGRLRRVCEEKSLLYHEISESLKRNHSDISDTIRTRKPGIVSADFAPITHGENRYCMVRFVRHYARGKYYKILQRVKVGLRLAGRG